MPESTAGSTFPRESTRIRKVDRLRRGLQFQRQRHRRPSRRIVLGVEREVALHSRDRLRPPGAEGERDDPRLLRADPTPHERAQLALPVRELQKAAGRRRGRAEPQNLQRLGLASEGEVDAA